MIFCCFLQSLDCVLKEKETWRIDRWNVASWTLLGAPMLIRRSLTIKLIHSLHSACIMIISILKSISWLASLDEHILISITWSTSFDQHLLISISWSASLDQHLLPGQHLLISISWSASLDYHHLCSRCWVLLLVQPVDLSKPRCWSKIQNYSIIHRACNLIVGSEGIVMNLVSINDNQFPQN